jgi:hypothetical protein
VIATFGEGLLPLTSSVVSCVLFASRIDRFLKNDEVGVGCFDRFCQWLFAASAAETYVVTQQFQRHASSSG